jgi:DNA-binding NarL/FixJ family response regulator
MNLPEFHTQHVLLGYSSEIDRSLFQQVVNDLPFLVHMSSANTCSDIKDILDRQAAPPDLLVLDLELSDSNGLECLQEIKGNKKCVSLPVVIYATTSYPAAINQLYENGAHLYIYKTKDTFAFIKSIQHLLSINWKVNIGQPPREEFVLTL